MKNKAIAVIAAGWRKQHGNEFRHYRITRVGRYDNFSADEIKDEIVRQSELSRKRVNRQIPVSVREHVKALVKHKLELIAIALPDDDMSMGSYFSADLPGYLSGISNRTHEYAKSCRYKAKHNTYGIDISPADICRLSIIAGRIFIKARTVADGVYFGDWITAEGKKQHYKQIRKPVYFTDQGAVYETREQIAQAVLNALQIAA